MFFHQRTRLRACAIVFCIWLACAPHAALADVTGTVRGTVNVDGRPLGGVTVTLRGDGTEASSSTDAAGAFIFVRVAFGRYSVVAHLPNRPDATSQVDVASDGVATVALAIGAAEIGRIAATSRGVSGTPVSANQLGAAAIAAAPQSQNLNRLIETLPGIVRFSYDEPVAHGFHGVLYELDGAPLPQTTSSSFSELFDPRNISSLEVFTGAFPAEFGGARQGAVVNVVTQRNTTIPNGAQTLLSSGIGTFGTLQAGVAQALRLGTTALFASVNTQHTGRALDAPTPTEVHDAGSLSDGFLRTITKLSPRDTLSFDFSTQYNTYQIPINLAANPNDSIVHVPGQDDTQREYSAFANLNYTHDAADGKGFFQVIPWWRYSRIVYAGDLANDVLAVDTSADDCAPAAPPCPLAGLAQDRIAKEFGMRAALFRAFGSHAFKAGVDASVENFTSAETIALPGAAPFLDNTAQRGTGFAAYVQDDWTFSPIVALQLGLRYDRSTGFVGGNELQPRIGLNVRLGPATVAHAYYGRLYAAPALEDTRLDAVVVGGGAPGSPLPAYDLQPEHDSYYEVGIAQTLRGGISGYLDAWQRNVWNAIDTTQLFPTPIFATFNNASGLAHGFELRLARTAPADAWYLSATYSQSVAGGISGGTFLFPPAAVSDTSLNPEDHDQTVAIKSAYTRRWGADHRTYATLGSDYGTGYPVQFENGSGRLLPHLTFDAAFGRAPAPGSPGFAINALNLTGYRYLIKVNNGFNTTQWAAGAQITARLLVAL
jgi:outer membrane receptor protein involved in Fe transport